MKLLIVLTAILAQSVLGQTYYYPTYNGNGVINYPQYNPFYYPGWYGNLPADVVPVVVINLNRLSIEQRQRDTFDITVRGAPGTSSSLQFSTDLRNWGEIWRGQLPSSGEIILRVTVGKQKGFFRLPR